MYHFVTQRHIFVFPVKPTCNYSQGEGVSLYSTACCTWQKQRCRLMPADMLAPILAMAHPVCVGQCPAFFFHHPRSFYLALHSPGAVNQCYRKWLSADNCQTGHTDNIFFHNCYVMCKQASSIFFLAQIQLDIAHKHTLKFILNQNN